MAFDGGRATLKYTLQAIDSFAMASIPEPTIGQNLGVNYPNEIVPTSLLLEFVLVSGQTLISRPHLEII